jgi:uncharacterized membrane protein
MTDASLPPDPGTPRRRRRWLPIALGVSVCLNLLLIGAAAGMMMRFGSHGPSPEPPAGFDRVTLYRVFRALPDAQKDAAREILREHRPELHALRGLQDEARLRIAGALEAEPFSSPALAASLASAREAERGGREIVDDAFVRFATSLSPETRREIAEELRAKRRWRHRDKDGDHRGHD